MANADVVAKYDNNFNTSNSGDATESAKLKACESKTPEQYGRIASRLMYGAMIDFQVVLQAFLAAYKKISLYITDTYRIKWAEDMAALIERDHKQLIELEKPKTGEGTRADSSSGEEH